MSHTAAISGGEHSLLTLLARMPPAVELGVACPEGPLAAAVRALGLPVHVIPGTSASFRLHPVHTLRATAEIAAAAIAVRRIARRRGATVLHANSVRAGLITGLARTGGGPPCVVHVRDVLPPGAAAQVVKRTLASRSVALIAISEYVQRQFAARPDAAITVIDNPVDQTRFDPGSCDEAECRQLLAGNDEGPMIGIIGQITPWKGHDTAIKALPLVREVHPGARLVVVGEVKFSEASTRLDNRGYLEELERLVTELHLEQDVRFVGERHDIPQILRALDILLVPSTAEPFGRTVAEAMTMTTPVIATTKGGPSEMIDHGVNGLLAPPGSHPDWASAINRMLSDRHASRTMARAARKMALNRFDADRHARAVTAILASASDA